MNRDAMLGQNHDVYHEFPEFADRINDLIERDRQFAHLVDKYTELNRKVIRAEQGVDAREHFDFERLKKRRLLHKDQLFAILNS